MPSPGEHEYACARTLRAVRLAVVVIIVLLAARALCAFCRGGRERFASKRAHEVFGASKEMFDRDRNATYTDYKISVPEADAVLYTDVRNLWRTGSLAPETVQKVL